MCVVSSFVNTGTLKSTELVNLSDIDNEFYVSYYYLQNQFSINLPASSFYIVGSERTKLSQYNKALKMCPLASQQKLA